MTNRPRLRTNAFHVIVLLFALASFGTPASAAEFNRSVPARRGMRLDVRLYGGTVQVSAWRNDSVRVRATHFATDAVELAAAGQTVNVRARSRVGRPHAIDLTIEVPDWMAVTVTGTYVDVGVEGTAAPVEARTVRGDVRVKGGAGTITLSSIEGEVVLEGAEGRANLRAVNNGIRVTGLNGDLVAETVNGSVRLDGVRSGSVSVGTTGGDVAWNGPLAGNGRYQFATHTGDIDVTLPAGPNATVSVRLFEGQFRSTLPVKLPKGRRNAPFGFVLGGGGARLDLETFRGTVSLRESPRG